MIGYCVIVQSLQLLRNSTVIAESNSSLLCSERFDARTAMWLKIQVFCDVLCRLANSTRPLDGSYCRPVQGPAGLALTLRKNTEDVFSFTNFFFITAMHLNCSSAVITRCVGSGTHGG